MKALNHLYACEWNTRIESPLHENEIQELNHLYAWEWNTRIELSMDENYIQELNHFYAWEWNTRIESPLCMRMKYKNWITSMHENKMECIKKQSKKVGALY